MIGGIRGIKVFAVILSFIALLSLGACVSRTSTDDIVLQGATGDLASVYIYMPKKVDIKGASSEVETLYANGAEVGDIRPGYSLGFLAPPGFITISTKGAYQEKLERVFYLNPGDRLFIAMEKGLNLRDRGFLFYKKTEAEGLDGIAETRFAPVAEQGRTP